MNTYEYNPEKLKELTNLYKILFDGHSFDINFGKLIIKQEIIDFCKNNNLVYSKELIFTELNILCIYDLLKNKYNKTIIDNFISQNKALLILDNIINKVDNILDPNYINITLKKHTQNLINSEQNMLFSKNLQMLVDKDETIKLYERLLNINADYISINNDGNNDGYIYYNPYLVVRAFNDAYIYNISTRNEIIKNINLLLNNLLLLGKIEEYSIITNSLNKQIKIENPDKIIY